jgi:hypothetical protein
MMHHPAVRKLPEGSWEVVCRDCGDKGSQASDLQPDLRAIRGPYPSFHAANEAAASHQSSAGEAPGP